MSESIIAVENLGKKYRLVTHRSHERYTALRDVIARKARSLFRNPQSGFRGRGYVSSDFWALTDVSFKVKEGEVLGIIGRNGAGKSTLLKILSRITEPTTGKIKLKGRVASLLEVGTGFHPELTGRENIFLNGAVLGMTRAEIRSKFDEIVAFAEVERFLDTPVKRYSSGMYVRLAFAVAAHLEPEILIVDEVLAVGDAQFQKKCLGRMSEVARGGRTVLFVSHNMSIILELCSRCLVFESGGLRADKSVAEGVKIYAQSEGNRCRREYEMDPEHPSITAVSIDEQALLRGDVIVDIEFASPYPLSSPVPGVVIHSQLGVPVFGSNPRFHRNGYVSRSADKGVLRLEAKAVPLAPGHYGVSAWLGDWHSDYDVKRDAISFEFRTSSMDSTRPSSETIGHVDWPVQWTCGI